MIRTKEEKKKRQEERKKYWEDMMDENGWDLSLYVANQIKGIKMDLDKWVQLKGVNFVLQWVKSSVHNLKEINDLLGEELDFRKIQEVLTKGEDIDIRKDEEKRRSWKNMMKANNWELSQYVLCAINRIKRNLDRWVEARGYTCALGRAKEDLQDLKELDDLFREEIDFRKIEEAIKAGVKY